MILFVIIAFLVMSVILCCYCNCGDVNNENIKPLRDRISDLYFGDIQSKYHIQLNNINILDGQIIVYDQFDAIKPFIIDLIQSMVNGDIENVIRYRQERLSEYNIDTKLIINLMRYIFSISLITSMSNCVININNIDVLIFTEPTKFYNIAIKLLNNVHINDYDNLMIDIFV